ncbi:MAG: sigma-70 family RNA polymerase sigma factor [Candidatus Brocadiia bacterium]
MDDSISTLARKLRDGDSDAFDELVRRFSGMVFAQAYSVLGNAEDAREAAQDVFLSLLKNAGAIRQPEALPGFLKRAARNKALDYLRRRHPAVPLDCLGERESDNDEHLPGAGIQEEERDSAISGKLAEAIADLPEDQREVIRLRYSRGYSYSEIAEYLNVGLDVVRGRLYRAHKSLEGRLGEFLKGVA